MTYEQWLAALCLWREARGQSIEALTAIFHVLLNRVNDSKGRWPKSLASVILQPFQFSSFNRDDPNSSKFPNPIHSDSPDWKAWVSCQAAVVNLVPDPTKGATNYVSLINGEIPVAAKDWATPERMTIQIGPFRFYKL